MPARNTLVQLLAATPTLRVTMHSITDRQTDRQTDGQTDGQQNDANSRSYCVAVQWTKNQSDGIFNAHK